MAQISSALPKRRPALFLDRDGVLIENKSDYVRSVGEAVPVVGAFEALGHLRKHRPEHLVIVVTNQAGIGKGIITHATVAAIHAHLARWARSAGGRIDAFYTCAERSDEPQRCRKPAPGMLLRAAREWSIDLSRSVMVGDAATDVQAGLAAGVAPMLVRTGRGAHEAERLLAAGLGAVPVVPDVAAAIERVIALSLDP